MDNARALAVATRTILRWYQANTALDCLSALFNRANRIENLTFRVIGTIYIHDDDAIIKSGCGSFMFLPPLKRAGCIETERSWMGRKLTLEYANAAFMIADYVLPETNDWR